ncbi:MAG: SLBB domain-containing protein [Aquabacterium sp.]
MRLPDRVAFAVLCVLGLMAESAAQGQAADIQDRATAGQGPIVLRNPSSELLRSASTNPARPPDSPAARLPLPTATEFETFTGVMRFGAGLMNELSASANDHNPVVPSDYLVAQGDEVQVTMWGAVEADLFLVVDRSGRITIPRVGPVMVAGVRLSDLTDVIQRRAAQTFKNFQVSTSLGRLRGIRVFVTGFVQRPGAYSVSALSTVMSALVRAGGPASSGSFRAIELRRGGATVTRMDLYDFIVNGARSGDVMLQPEDVIHVHPVGPQVALRGSVNHQAIFEMRAGETLSDLLRWSGGFNPVADRTRVSIERLDERKAQRVVQVALPEGASSALAQGDLVRVFSAVDSALSTRQQNKRVRVEGEVRKAGDYVLPADSTVADAIAAAGGLTEAAFVFGTHFTRQSVRVTQQENYDRALRELEAELVRADASKRGVTSEESQAQGAANARLLERMRTIRPDGRIVLQLPIEGGELPALALEDGDRLFVPSKPTTVGVFGSVFNAGSYLHGQARTLGDFVRLAGGSTRSADSASTFVIRANGTVISARQGSSWFNTANLDAIPALPGDTVFVPEETNKTSLVQSMKDWSQVFYQLGLGLAAIQTFRN